MSRIAKWTFIVLLLLQAGFFFYVSQHRLIDNDEGYYLLASRLVLQHKTPYLDFFFPQAPLLVYVFGGWLKLAGVSWYSARVLCALLSTLVGALIYLHVIRETRKWLAGACAVLLFATASLDFAWYPIVKTFALAMLFLFPAYMVLARLSPSTPGWAVALSGALFGLSADARSYIVGLLPVFLWWLWRKEQGRSVARLAWFLGGVAVGAIPSLLLFVASPSAFLFNNLGYHAMRSGVGLVGDWRDKAWVIAALVGGAYTGFQFTITSVAALVLIVGRRIRRPASLLALVLGIALGLISMLPTPASIQYFSLIMPFLIVAAVCGASDWFASTQSPAKIRRATTACAVMVACFVAFASPILRQYLYTGGKVPGIHGTDDAHNWTLAEVTAVSEAVNELVRPGDEVASFWPGYIFATSAAPYPGWEDNFGIWIAPNLSPQKRAQYHLLTLNDMAQSLAIHGPRLVVVSSNQGEWNAEPDFSLCDAALRASGYKVARSAGSILVYECCASR